MPSKNVLNNLVRNKWLAQPVIVKPDSVLGKLLNVDRNSRNEATHYSFHCVYRYTPYSKKPKNMIDAESVKIVTHLLKSLVPPFKMVLLHFLPVIGWEAPILTFYCEIIRWRPRLLVHI